MDLLREMALYSLFQFPLATNSYSLLCNVVFVIKASIYVAQLQNIDLDGLTLITFIICKNSFHVFALYLGTFC